MIHHIEIATTCRISSKTVVQPELNLVLSLTRARHETLSDLRSPGSVRRRFSAAVRDHGGLGLLDRYQLGRGGKVLRRLRQDAVLCLPVRRRAGADDCCDPRHSVSPAADPPGGADAD